MGNHHVPVPGRMKHLMRVLALAAAPCWGQDQLPLPAGLPGVSPAGMPGVDASEKKPSPASPAAPASMPTEVVIRADDPKARVSASKPPLALEVDPFETIRPSLKAEEPLLLAVSPLTVSWRRTHPETLKADRVIQPWRVTFSPKPGIAFRPRDQLFEVLQRRLENKEAKEYAWSLTIADEEGRVFHRYEGSDDPPEELVWSGQNEQGEWISAGRSYSAVYNFTDPGGSPRTTVGKPLLFRGIVHQEDSGLHLSLDSSVLFGGGKAGAELVKPVGADLIRAAADLVKRRFHGIPIAVRVFSSTKELGETQGLAVSTSLSRELMLGPQAVTVSAARAPYSEQRVEIVLLNR